MKHHPLIANVVIATITIATLVACGTPSANLAAPTAEITLEQLGTMTLEQLQTLSPEQLAEIEKKVDADVARVEAKRPAPETKDGPISAQAASDCGSFISPAWPNAALTKQCAINNDYKKFNSSIYNSFNGPDWSDDGCSNVPDYVFAEVCRHHDFAYRNLPQYAQFRNAATREQADDRFYSNMIARCNDRFAWYNPQRPICKGVAFTYYTGVRVGGSSAYNDAMQRYP
jgi:Prokaryotic phospholipase A2